MTPDRFRAISARQTETNEWSARAHAVAPLSAFPVFIGQVFGNPQVPTSTGAYVSVHPVDVAGVESESSPGVLTVDTSRTLLVYVVGSSPPVAGDNLVCRFVGNRWVAERMAKHVTGIPISGCPCSTTPATLTMTASAPLTNNQIFRNATLAYGPIPPALSTLSLGPNGYLSTTPFADVGTGELWYYYFFCFLNIYCLARVYPVSFVYGSGGPFRDQIRYRWFIGFQGNTCTPFNLPSGFIFTGGDPTCVVTISG